MKKTTTSQLVNARIKVGNKTKLTKVIKVQLFSLKDNKKSHLIGNIYYHRLTNMILEGVVETDSKCLTNIF